MILDASLVLREGDILDVGRECRLEVVVIGDRIVSLRTVGGGMPVGFKLAPDDSEFAIGPRRFIPGIGKIVQEEETMGSNMMGVFEVIAVDRRSCEILKREVVVANSEASALALVDFTPEQKKRATLGEVIVAARVMIQFERIVPVEVKNVVD